MQGCGRALTTEVASRSCRCWHRPCRPGRAHAVSALAQGDRRLVRLTVAGPPDGQPPRMIEVDDPLSTPAELITSNDNVHIQKAGITKSEAREQAAIIQAQREEISTLRKALAETQDVMFKGKSALNEVVQTKDLQIAQLYELAASGVRERAKLRQELSEIQAEMQGTKRQLHAFMASLMQLKSSMDSAGDGDIEHALELLQSSSWTQSLQGSPLGVPLTTDDDVYMQLVQMQKLSDTLVQDMQQDEELMQQGLEPRSRLSSMDSFDSPLSSIDQPLSSSSSKVLSTAVPATAVPNKTVPKSTVPKSTVPISTVPNTTVPNTTVPSTAVPSTAVPGSKVVSPSSNNKPITPSHVTSSTTSSTTSSSTSSSTNAASGNNHKTPAPSAPASSSGSTSGGSSSGGSSSAPSTSTDGGSSAPSSSPPPAQPAKTTGWGVKAPSNGSSNGNSANKSSGNGKGGWPRWH